MQMNPSKTNARKVSATLTYRVAMRRHFLSLPINRSTTLRHLYWILLNPTARSGYVSSWFLRCGMSGVNPRCSIASRTASESYPLSPETTEDRRRGGPGLPVIHTLSSIGSNMVVSCCWPGVISTVIGSPRPSHSTWSLVDNPLREFPKPCCSRLFSAEPLFFAPRRRSVKLARSIHRLPKNRNRCAGHVAPRPPAHRAFSETARSHTSGESGRKRSTTDRSVPAGRAKERRCAESK